MMQFVSLKSSMRAAAFWHNFQRKAQPQIRLGMIASNSLINHRDSSSSAGASKTKVSMLNLKKLIGNKAFGESQSKIGSSLGRSYGGDRDRGDFDRDRPRFDRERSGRGGRDWKSSSGSGGGGGGSRGRFGGGGGGGGRGRGRAPSGDPFAKLTFKQTIRIDPDLKTPVSDMIHLSPKTLEVLESKGFTEMTPVQSQSFDEVFEGNDVVARSRTGTGKTFAFGLPLIERIVADGYSKLRSAREGLPVIIILEPTRELAMQVAQELSSVCKPHKLRVTSIYGGAAFNKQVELLQEGVHIIVATPGRMLDHISRGTVDLSHIKHVVLDEGDTMLEMGFQQDVESILMSVKEPGEKARLKASKALAARDAYPDDEDEDDYDDEDEDDDDEDDLDNNRRSDVQMLLFSATMPGWICKITDKLMKNPIFLDAVQEGETRLASTITHYSLPIPSRMDRMQAVASFAEDLILTKGAGGQTIIFTNTKDEADRLTSGNVFKQLKSQVLHGDISQAQRASTLRQFKEKFVDVLVATDVAARGLDIAGVDLVVHTAPPNDPDSYVHRSGRTGRAGRSGNSILLYTPDEERKLQMFQKTLNFAFNRIGPPGASEIAEACAVLVEKRLENVNDDVVDFFLPYAKDIIAKAKQGKIPGVLDELDNDDEEESPVKAKAKRTLNEKESVEDLMARCLAAISNRNSISSRSLLTGEGNFVTLKVNITPRSGDAPETVVDYQTMMSGFIRKKLEVTNFRFGKMVIGIEDGSKKKVLVADMEKDAAEEILQKMNQLDVQGIQIERCASLPKLVEAFNRGDREGRFDRGGSRGGDRFGGDRDRRGGYGGSSSGGRSWQSGAGGGDRKWKR